MSRRTNSPRLSLPIQRELHERSHAHTRRTFGHVWFRVVEPCGSGDVEVDPGGNGEGEGLGSVCCERKGRRLSRSRGFRPGRR
jgi:hypothetical protein